MSEAALSPIHDFAAKLQQDPLAERVRAYVHWQRDRLAARRAGRADPAMLDWAPLSINLDLTTACNFACDHCVDWDILNSRASYDTDRLFASLSAMAERGLLSVILIGGGEPTVHPRFRETVRFLKELGLQVAVVSNGGLSGRILDVIDAMDGNDWIRLSLDAGTDATFQALHRPKKAVSLEEICAWIPRMRDRNPAPRVGFSFVLTWQGAERQPGVDVVSNLDEIVEAARLARRSRFDYISFKPFLVRTPAGAEVIDPEAAERRHAEIVARIRSRVDEAKKVATDAFAVLESTNLKLLESGTWRDWTHQPHTCHMQAFRQVLSPLGLWNCPAQRGVDAARIGGPDAWAGNGTAAAVAARLDEFDAADACREITCLYHDANWWLEELIHGPADALDFPAVPGEDHFL